MADETKKTDAVQTVFDQVTSSVDTAVAEGSAGLKDKIVRKLADEELGKRSELFSLGFESSLRQRVSLIASSVISPR